MSDHAEQRAPAGPNTYAFAGQRAAITGGAQEFGRAVAQRLRANGAEVERAMEVRQLPSSPGLSRGSTPCEAVGRRRG